jgi:hypothetical protein
LRVVLHAARGNLLVSADADVINADDVNHFLETVNVFIEARKEVPYADRATSIGNRVCMIAANLPGCQEGLSSVPGNPGEFTWNGAYGTQFFCDPKERLVVVVGTAAPGELRKYYREQVQNLVYGAMVR